jgi:signal transduction histidine kinase
MRIARDLHDAVAHHIAVVSVYTGLARTTLNSSVEKTEDALAKAQESTRSVLSELQQIVHILRDSENSPNGSRQPAPDFGSIDDLVTSFGETGFRVTYRVHGQPGMLPTSTGLVAYRIVQEALTNASKYGDGSASVDVTFGIDSLRIVVVNRISDVAHESLGTGHGLIGMRERVRLVDGSLTFTSDADTFTLVSVLPWTPQEVTPEVKRNGVVEG